MFGKILLEEFEGLTKLPQEYASAFMGATEKVVGADYKPLLCLGRQVVNGKNYFFIAEQTLTTADVEKSIVLLAVNEFNGKFIVVPHSIEKIIG